MIKALRDSFRRRRSIRKNVSYGANFVFGNNTVVWAPRSMQIGSDVSLGSDVRIEADGVIGDHVLIANSSAIVGRTDHEHSVVGISIRKSRWVGDHPDELSCPTVVGSDVWVGYGVVILSGVTIGDSSIIGAGSVVTKDVPPNSIAVGNPARVISNRYSDSQFVEHWVRLEALGISRTAQ